MAINEDIENQETGDREGVRERLLVPLEKDRAGKDEGTNEGCPWMVYFTTFVAVCGSYELGTCAGYSSPTQDAIVEELSLSTAEECRVYLRVLRSTCRVVFVRCFDSTSDLSLKAPIYKKIKVMICSYSGSIIWTSYMIKNFINKTLSKIRMLALSIQSLDPY